MLTKRPLQIISVTMSTIRCTYLSHGQLVSIGVHGGHDVYAGAVDEILVLGSALLVLLAHDVDEFEQNLAAHHLVAMHVTHVFKLGLLCKITTHGGSMIM